MADFAVLGGLLSQLLDLLMLGREPGDGKCLERGELGQRLVPFRDSFLEFGDLGLEPASADRELLRSRFSSRRSASITTAVPGSWSLSEASMCSNALISSQAPGPARMRPAR